MEKQSCYLCGHGDMQVLRNKLRHGIHRNVIKCGACGIVYLQPTKQDLKEYYKEEYKKEYSGIIGDSLNSSKNFEMSLPYQQARVDEIKELLSPEMRALDIGCSAGYFLYTLKDLV